MSLLSTSGEFVAWETVGDTVVGTITDIGLAPESKFGGGPALAIHLEDDNGDAKSIAVRVADLKRKLADVLVVDGTGDDPNDYRPNIGARLAVKFTGEEKLANGNRAKLFQVDYKPATPASSAAGLLD